MQDDVVEAEDFATADGVAAVVAVVVTLPVVEIPSVTWDYQQPVVIVLRAVGDDNSFVCSLNCPALRRHSDRPAAQELPMYSRVGHLAAEVHHLSAVVILDPDPAVEDYQCQSLMSSAALHSTVAIVALASPVVEQVSPVTSLVVGSFVDVETFVHLAVTCQATAEDT